MNVDEQAPVRAGAEIEIPAPLDLVWRLVSDIDAWPGWNPAVAEAHLDGPLAAGTEFRWRAGRARIVSTLRAVEPPHLIGWTGRMAGIEAAHVYRLRDCGETTAVETEESWDGRVVRLLRRPARRMLTRSLTSGLAHLREAAERRR